MITVGELIGDPDLTAPQPYTLFRSMGQWVAGGFQSTTTTTQLFGPVQQASNKEIAMLPEADRIGSVFAFWSTQPFYTTRGYAAAPGTHGEQPNGAVPGTAYTLSAPPPNASGWFYINGLLQTPNAAYTLTGASITTAAPTPANAVLWFEWPIAGYTSLSASDILQYEQTQYRVLQTYHDPGCGYWKALATRMPGA